MNPFIKVEPTPLTPEEMRVKRLEQLIASLNRDGQSLLEQSVNTIESNWNKVWENELFTPAEVLEQMGTSAVEIFRTSALFTAAVYQIGAGATPPVVILDEKYLSAKLPWVGHEDGTITLA